MRKKIAYACALLLTCVGTIALPAAPSLAQSSEKYILVQDLKAYIGLCVLKSDPPAATCVNLKAQWVDKQHKLNLSDADLEALLFSGTKHIP